MIISKFEVRNYKNGLPHYGEVLLNFELTDSKKLEIIEEYSGEGFISQGYVEVFPKKGGYDDWKKAINNGIQYAFSRLTNKTGLKVYIKSACGLTTDTNSIILEFAASRAILNKLENLESKYESEKLEQLVFSSWNYDTKSFINFNELKIDGERNRISHYRI